MDSPASAEIGVLEIEEGDCVVSDLDGAVSLESVTIVPCSDVWQYRVTGVFDVEDRDRYPGGDALGDEALLGCGADAAYVVFPSAESWDIGDRTVVCFEEAPAPTTTPAPATTAVAATSTTAAVLEESSGLALSASEVYELVAESIAFVETATGTGSGILVDGGYVVTNHHVVWPHETVWVVFPDGTEVGDVPVVGWDPFADLAVLGPVSVSAPPLSLGNGEAMSAGSTVFLVGYPAETDLFPQVSITEGIISRFREWDLAGMTLIQTDAAIAGGQSGGALVNSSGEVIGISTWSFSEAGFSVATSAADDAPIIESLIDQEAAIAWHQSVGLPGAGNFESAVELVNRWDSRAFTFIGEAGSTVEVAINGAADGVFAISGPQGILLEANDSDSGIESGSVEILTGGIHFVQVSTALDGPAAFAVSSSSRLQEFDDPDDGQHLAVGDVVAGVIDYYGDVDWYTITLDQGDTVAIWTDSIATDTIVFVDFPEADISTIVYDDDSGSSPFGMSVNAELIYTAPATGRFIIAIANSGGGGGAGYYLGVDPVQPANPTDQAVDTVWQELFNEFAPAAQDCIRATFGNQRLDEYLQVSLDGSVPDQLIETIFGCLSEEEAEDVLVFLTLTAFLDTYGGFEPQDVACLEDVTAEADVSRLMSTGYSGTDRQAADELDELRGAMHACFEPPS